MQYRAQVCYEAYITSVKTGKISAQCYKAYTKIINIMILKYEIQRI